LRVIRFSLRGLIFAFRIALFAGQQACCGLCGLCGVTFGLLYVRARGQTVIDDEERERVHERVAAVDVAKDSGMVCTRLPHDLPFPCRGGRI
jgi:hypothetical protein